MENIMKRPVYCYWWCYSFW